MPERLPQHVSEAFLPHPPKRLGVAVSGGSDSMALLHLLREFCTEQKIDLHAVTVNHGLRDGAKAEAEAVAQQCARIDVPHQTLVWDGWAGKGNLQSAARDARYAKMSEWARARDIDTVAVGHTADDQAETVLMRLSRRAGVDGLSGMNARMSRNGITWVRPLLGARRNQLRAYLKGQGIGWADDPSNEDERFERIRIRKVMALLEPLGIDTEALSDVAGHMLEARKALDWQTFLAARQLVKMEAGALVLDETALRLQPAEIQRRLIVKAINWVSGADHLPRMQAVSNLLAAIRKGQAGTVDGCHMRRIAARIWIFRELNAVSDHRTATDEVWDGRWQAVPNFSANHAPDLTIAALGPLGIEQCKRWRDTGLPHVVLQSTPAVWRGVELVAAPLAGYPENWRVEVVGSADTFFAALLSH